MTTWTHVLWTDLIGHPHVVRVRTSVLGKRRLTVDRSQVTRGFGHPSGSSADDPALVLVPDPATERANPWQPDAGLVIADLAEPEDEPSALCGRSALRRVLGRLADDGYRVSCAAELEFYLVDRRTREPVYADIENYSVTKGAEFEPIMRQVRNQLQEMGVTIEASNPEYSGGQFEVNILHGPALESADRAILLRAAVRALARDAGLDATFMAKPWTDRSGSGMHVHQSLWRGDDNVLHGGHELSPAGRHYVAGLLRRMREFTLFGSPSPNAYHRRSDYTFSPTVLCWGFDNRTLAVRAIVGTPGSTRFEQRDASAEANPYLVFAGQLSAGMEGVSDGIEPPEPLTGDAYSRGDLERLPTSFGEAYRLLEESDAARLGLGAGTVEAYLAMLAPELDLVRSASADWERNRYFTAV